jgi:hypothetical protein
LIWRIWAGRILHCFVQANMLSKVAEHRSTTCLWESSLVESRQQPAPGRTIEQACDLNPIAGLVGPNRLLSLGSINALDRPRVEAKGA